MMRGVLFLGFVGVTCYFAALYRSAALMTISVSAVVFGVILFVLSRCLSFRVRVSFLRGQDIVRKGEPYRCEYEAENRSRIPCGRVRFVLRIRGGEKQKKKTAVQGRLAGKEKIRAHVNVRFSRCGVFQVERRRLRVWDPLAFFSAGRRKKERMQITVLPPERRLSLAAFRSADVQEKMRFLPDNLDSAQEEIRQLREYQPGDLPRHIHWNLSARSELLWIKEFEGETDQSAVLYLTNERSEHVTSDGLEAFYEITSALIFGLIEAGISLELVWNDAKGKREEHVKVSGRTDGAEAFRKLYRLDRKQFLGRMDDAEQEELLSLRLDYDRRLYVREQEVYRFSAGQYETELEEGIIL